MRATAPFIAVLAFAALSFGEPTLSAAPLHARPHHPRKTQVQATAAPEKHPKSKAKPQTKPAPEVTPKHGRHHRQTVEDTVPATVTRIRHTQKRSAPSPIPSTARHATSADFVRAAGGPAAPAPGPSPAATAPALPDATQQMSVVSIIRPTTQRPALPAIQEEASNPVLLPTLYNKRGHLIVPRALKGSHEILVRQNQVADQDGLDRIQTDADLIEARRQNFLVAIPTGNELVVADNLPVDRRYCRPWTAGFLVVLSRAYYQRFHTPIQVNSAVRTVEFQQRLLRTNGNAAPAEGDTASPHLTGQAVDLAKHGLTLTQIAWLRGYLLPLVQQGKIDVEEEFQQSCFHISVYKKYLPSANIPRRSIASTHRGDTTSLATAIQ